MKSHIETNHINIGQFGCTMCENLFNSKQELRQNTNIVHGQIKHKENSDTRTDNTNDSVETFFFSCLMSMIYITKFRKLNPLLCNMLLLWVLNQPHH